MHRNVIAASIFALVLTPAALAQKDLLNPGGGGSGRSLDLLRGLDTPPATPRQAGSPAKPLPYRPGGIGAKDIFGKVPFPFVGPRFSGGPFGVQWTFPGGRDPATDARRSIREIFKRDLGAPSLEIRYRHGRGVQVQRAPERR